MLTITVPGSSANIGPGFDTIGLALTLYLTVTVTLTPVKISSKGLQWTITCEGVNAQDISCDPRRNLICQVATYVLQCHDKLQLDSQINLHINNQIPLGRGLGSSGASIVAGATIANQIADLDLTKQRLLEYCLMVERHADNITASLFGNMVITLVHRRDPPLDSFPDVLDPDNTQVLPPPEGLVSLRQCVLSPDITCILVIPAFVLPTTDSRNVLPDQYTRGDLVYNMQRTALLANALSDSPLDDKFIFELMQDKVHQPYRMKLIPGFNEILDQMNPERYPGLLGVCLSGAGPSILAFARTNVDKIAARMQEAFKSRQIDTEVKILHTDDQGTRVHHCS